MRSPMKILAMLAVIGATLLGNRSLPVEAAAPNIVLIIADDQAYRDFGFMGNELVHTPHLDRLAAQSARYPQGYVPMSVCRPSLATLLTGLYPHQHGIHFNHPPPGLKEMRKLTAEQYHATRARADYLIENVATLPRILAQHGYVCLQTGKYWEGDYRIAGFTEGMTLGRPAKRLGQVTGTRAQENGQPVAHGNGDAGLVIGRETMQPIHRFIDKYAGRQPFFLWYAPFLPHTPYDAARRFRKLYEGQSVPRHLLPYYASIARFDETVGQLLGQLQRNSLLRQTLIVFVSDNGLRPDPKRPDRQDSRSKLSPFENGLRTPFLIRWDGHSRAADHQGVVQAIDLVPTMLAAAGLSSKITPRMKGLNLMPSARGEKALPTRAGFGAIYPNDAIALGEPSRHVRGRWMREGRFKLTVPGPAKPPLPLALFDLRADPGEKVNLVNDPEQADRLLKMKDKLDRWWRPGDDSKVTKKLQP